MASCGAPASQTHVSTVVGSSHESYAKNTTRRRRQGKQEMRGSGEEPGRTRSRHEGQRGERRKCDMITRDMRLEGWTWVGAKKKEEVCAAPFCA
jgi:hypothetical protein